MTNAELDKEYRKIKSAGHNCGACTVGRLQFHEGFNHSFLPAGRLVTKIPVYLVKCDHCGFRHELRGTNTILP